MSQQQVGVRIFSSKDALKKATKEILLNNKYKKIEEGSETYSFLLELLDRHPEKEEKIGPGIAYFYCGDGFGSDNTQLRLHRTDGTNDTVSWVTCCEARGQSPNTILSAMLRKEIAPDIIEFFQNSIKKCACCGGEGKLEVDHIIAFKDLRDRFLKEFVAFHKKEATLQLLCIPCHQKKTNP